MIINDLDGYYIVFDTKNWNTELDTLDNNRCLFNKTGNNDEQDVFFRMHGHPRSICHVEQLQQ